jgi:hypothetical protein
MIKKILHSIWYFLEQVGKHRAEQVKRNKTYWY